MVAPDRNGADDAAGAKHSLVIGVAIEVPEPWRSELVVARDRYSSAEVSTIPPHITLLPPADVPEWQLDAVQAHLARVAEDCPAFDVRLRGTATFRPVSPVVFLSVVEGISGCERLERGIRSGVLLRRRHFPYHPHVTLAQEVADDVLDQAFDEFVDYSARFAAEAFTLSVRDESGAWSRLTEFTLRGSSMMSPRARRP